MTDPITKQDDPRLPKLRQYAKDGTSLSVDSRLTLESLELALGKLAELKQQADTPLTTDINRYASESVDEYPEIKERWRQSRLRAYIEQAYRWGLRDAATTDRGFREMYQNVIKAIHDSPDYEAISEKLQAELAALKQRAAEDTRRLDVLEEIVTRCSAVPARAAHLRLCIETTVVHTAESKPGYAGQPKWTLREAADSLIAMRKENPGDATK